MLEAMNSNRRREYQWTPVWLKSIRFALHKLHRLQRVITLNPFRPGRAIRPSKGYTEGVLILCPSRIWTSSLMIKQNQVNGWKFSVSAWEGQHPVSRSVYFLGIATDMQLIQDSKNPYNEEVQVYELTGGVELVPLLTSRRYCSQSQLQNNRHVATDATRPGYTIDPYVLCFENEFSRYSLTLYYMHHFHF